MALISHPQVRARLVEDLTVYNKQNLGSSRRIGRVMLMTEPPEIDAGEITDKGYINQRAVQERRADLVERLYAESPDPEVIQL